MASANYTKKQLDELKVWFDLNATPSRRQVDNISEQLGLKSATVWIWFHRQRIREKSKKETSKEERKMKVKFDVNGSYQLFSGRKEGLALYGSKVKSSNAAAGKCPGEAIPGTQNRPHVCKEQTENVACRSLRSGILKHVHSSMPKQTRLATKTAGKECSKEEAVIKSPWNTRGIQKHEEISSKEHSCSRAQVNQERLLKSAALLTLPPKTSSKLSDLSSPNDSRPRSEFSQKSVSPVKQHISTNSGKLSKMQRNPAEPSTLVQKHDNKSPKVLFNNNTNVSKRNFLKESVLETEPKTNLLGAVQEFQEQVSKLRHVTRAVNKRKATGILKSPDRNEGVNIIPMKRKKNTSLVDDSSKNIANVSAVTTADSIGNVNKTERKPVSKASRRHASPTVDCNANVVEDGSCSKSGKNHKSDPAPDSECFGSVLASVDNPLRHRSAEKNLRSLKKKFLKETDNSHENIKSKPTMLKSKSKNTAKQKVVEVTKNGQGFLQDSPLAARDVSPRTLPPSHMISVSSLKRSVKKSAQQSASPKISVSENVDSAVSITPTVGLVQKDQQAWSPCRSSSSPPNQAKETFVKGNQKSPKGMCIPVISGRRESESRTINKKEFIPQRKPSSSNLREIPLTSSKPKTCKKDLHSDGVKASKNKTAINNQSTKKVMKSPSKEKRIPDISEKRTVTSQCKSPKQMRITQDTNTRVAANTGEAAPPGNSKQMNVCSPSPGKEVKKVTKRVISKEKYWKAFNGEFLFKKSLSVNLVKINLPAALASRKVTVGQSAKTDKVPKKEVEGKGQKTSVLKEEKEKVLSRSPDRSLWSSLAHIATSSSDSSSDSDIETTDEEVQTQSEGDENSQDSSSVDPGTSEISESSATSSESSSDSNSEMAHEDEQTRFEGDENSLNGSVASVDPDKPAEIIESLTALSSESSSESNSETTDEDEQAQSGGDENSQDGSVIQFVDPDEPSEILNSSESPESFTNTNSENIDEEEQTQSKGDDNSQDISVASVDPNKQVEIPVNNFGLDANQNECQSCSDNEDVALCVNDIPAEHLGNSLLDEGSSPRFVVVDEVTCSDFELESSGTSEGRCSSEGFHQRDDAFPEGEVINCKESVVDTKLDMCSSESPTKETELKAKMKRLDPDEPGIRVYFHDSFEKDQLEPSTDSKIKNVRAYGSQVCNGEEKYDETSESANQNVGEDRENTHLEQTDPHPSFKEVVHPNLGDGSNVHPCEEHEIEITDTTSSDIVDNEVHPVHTDPVEVLSSEKQVRRKSETIDIEEQKVSPTIAKLLEERNLPDFRFHGLNFVPMVVDEIADDDSHSGVSASQEIVTSPEINKRDACEKNTWNQIAERSDTTTRSPESAGGISPDAPVIDSSCEYIKDNSKQVESSEILAQPIHASERCDQSNCTKGNTTTEDVSSHGQLVTESKREMSAGKDAVSTECCFKNPEKVPRLAVIAGRYLKTSSSIEAVVLTEKSSDYRDGASCKVVLCGMSSSEDEGNSSTKPTSDEHCRMSGIKENADDGSESSVCKNTPDNVAHLLEYTGCMDTSVSTLEGESILSMSAEDENCVTQREETLGDSLLNPARDSISPCSTVCYPSDIASMRDFSPIVPMDNLSCSEESIGTSHCEASKAEMIEEKLILPVSGEISSDCAQAKEDNDSTSNAESLLDGASCQDNCIPVEDNGHSSVNHEVTQVDDTETSPLTPTTASLAHVKSSPVSENIVTSSEPPADKDRLLEVDDDPCTGTTCCDRLDTPCSGKDVARRSANPTLPYVSRIKQEPADDLITPTFETEQSKSTEKAKRKRGLDELVSDLRTSKVICTGARSDNPQPSSSDVIIPLCAIPSPTKDVTLPSCTIPPPTSEATLVSCAIPPTIPPTPSDVTLPYCSISINRNTKYSTKSTESAIQPQKPVCDRAGVPKGRIRVNKNFKRPPIPESVRQRIEKEAPLPFEQDWKKVTPIIKEAMGDILISNTQEKQGGRTQSRADNASDSVGQSEMAANTIIPSDVGSNSTVLSSHPILESMLQENVLKPSPGQQGKTTDKPPRKRRNSRKSKKKPLTAEDIADEIAAKRALFADGFIEMRDIEMEWMQILKAIESPSPPRTASEEVGPIPSATPVSCPRNQPDRPPPSYKQYIELRRSSQESPKVVSSSDDIVMPSIVRVYSLQDEPDEDINVRSCSQSAMQAKVSHPHKNMEEALVLSESGHSSTGMPQDGSSDMQWQDVTCSDATTTLAGNFCVNDDKFIDVESVSPVSQTTPGNTCSSQLLQGKEATIQTDNGIDASGQMQVTPQSVSGNYPAENPTCLNQPLQNESSGIQDPKSPAFNCSVTGPPGTVRLSNFGSPPVVNGSSFHGASPVITFPHQRLLPTGPPNKTVFDIGTNPPVQGVVPGINTGSTLICPTAKPPKSAALLLSLLANPSHVVPSYSQQVNLSSVGFQAQSGLNLDRSSSASPPLCTLYPTRVSAVATVPTSTRISTTLPQNMSPLTELHQMTNQYHLWNDRMVQQPQTMGNTPGMGGFQQRNPVQYRPILPCNTNAPPASYH